MDSQFPDIFSKPGKFLPGVFDKKAPVVEELKFEEINIEEGSPTLNQAKELQDKF